MNKRLVAAALAAAVLAGCTAGSVAAASPPRLKAYTGIGPPVHLFGDTIRARLSVLADAGVDPASLQVSAIFAPYVAQGPPRVATLRSSPVEQVAWTWTLRCLSPACLPAHATEKSRAFRFPPARITHLGADGKPDSLLTAAWPQVEVLSRLGPVATRDMLERQRYDWRYSVAPVAAPTFRLRPQVLFWLALGAAIALAALGLAVAARWCLEVDPAYARASTTGGTPLARAIALLTWAHSHGNETLQRKALGRVGDELGVARTTNGLSDTARELAWRAELPDDAEVQDFARRAREAESEANG
jgi:hypothetical protein